MLPPDDKLSICFAHVAYQLHERFSALDTGINSFAVRDPETLENRVGEADVLVISGLWQDSLLRRAGKLRFIQAIGAGTDQFPLEELKKLHPELSIAWIEKYVSYTPAPMAKFLEGMRKAGLD